MLSLKALLLVASCLLVAQLAAGKQRELPPFEDASLHCHRLPINVKPTEYNLHLKFPSLDSDVYEGQVNISVDFLKNEAKMLADWGLENVDCASKADKNTIVLHADKSIEIQDIKVISQTSLSCLFGCQRKQRKIVKLIRDESNQMIAIRVKEGIHASSNGSPGEVSITFKGRMRADKRGVYLSTYNDGKRVYKHVVSQFQPTDARTVFPCFDEPRFRVPFSVRVSHPRGLTAYGNTEVQEIGDDGDLTSCLFAATPPMPVHMVAFTIGEFDKPLEIVSTSFKNSRTRKIRVITAPGKRETGHFALEVANKSLGWFERYIYYDYPLEKLDVIAIADHDKDNTESWGLVFVRDTLIWIDDETKLDTRVTTAVNVAHVVVHQWFGNLISVEWWSDLWITEGVAAQMAFKFVEDNYHFDSEYFVRLATLSSVLQADQAGNLHPLSPSEENLRTSEQIYGIFDNLEFMKSASMAQMVEELADSRRPRYQDHLQWLIRNYAYKAIRFEDYQAAMSHSEDMEGLLKTFPKYTGVPLVNCEVLWVKSSSPFHNHFLTITLEPFDEARVELGSVNKPRWRELKIKIGAPSGTVPIVASPDDWGLVGFPGRQLKPSFNLKDNFVKLDSRPSIATYYRTRYSEEIYESLEREIKSKSSIYARSRLQIIDDANSLVQAGLIKLDRFKSLLDSYENEDHPAVILAILKATNTYRALAPEDVSSLQSNKAILSIFEKDGFKLPSEFVLIEGYGLFERGDEFIQERARQVVLTTLIKEGNEQVVAAALEAFDEADGKVPLFLREPVYTAVVLSGSSERVKQLLSHLSETKSYEEQIRLVTALTLSKDKEVLTEVKSWLESSGLKAETIKPFLDTISKVLSQ